MRQNDPKIVANTTNCCNDDVNTYLGTRRALATI